ncbi:MAG: 5,6-dimethylbenzimidazole synthase [Rickettsiales bacterium]
MSGEYAFSDAERQAVYRAIEQRRDVRKFRSDPIEEDVLERILRAAACAPSVGYMQPYNFILVHEQNIRQKIYDAFSIANAEAKEMFAGSRRDDYAALKLEGIRESALNICVTCDRERFGKVILGRTHQPDMDLYSSVCAVQNLWLAARAEGVGVGWVSIIKYEDLREILCLPENVMPVAYLCVGYTDGFANEPELKTYGWLPEIAFEEMIFYNKWNGKK